MKMIFFSNANKTHFHFKGFVLSFVLKARVSGTRKWPNNLGVCVSDISAMYRVFQKFVPIFSSLYFFFFFNVFIDNHINHLFTVQSC